MGNSIITTWRRAAVVCLLALLGTVWAFAAHAGPSQKAEGLWEYMPVTSPTDPPPILLACDDFPYPFLVPMIAMLTEDGRWSGTFNGTSVEKGKLIIHCTGGFSFFATVTFDAVAVNGKVGTLFLHVEGTKPDPFADWCGSWSVVDGTGELVNLSGHGDWWGPGYSPLFPDEWGQIYYDGKIKWSDQPTHVVKHNKCLDKICDDDSD